MLYNRNHNHNHNNNKINKHNYYRLNQFYKIIVNK